MSKNNPNQPSADDQINSAIKLIKNAKTNPELTRARDQAFAFIDAAQEKDEITSAQSLQFEKKVRAAYRSQLGAKS